MDKPTEQYLVLNGNYLLQSNAVLKSDNRSFLYGDGFFETFRVVNKQPWDLDAHFKRIEFALQHLKIEKASYFTQERIEQHIHQLIERNNVYSDARVRLAIFRSSSMGYTPLDNQLSYLLTVENIPGKGFQLNQQGLAVDLYEDYRKQVSPLTMFKSSNSQLYVLAGIDAQEKGLDEGLILNEKGAIIESTNSNIFAVCNGVLYTPALSEGCVAGTMRMKIMNLAMDMGLKIFECSLNHQRLMSADEVFLTNAVRGIQWVNRYKSKRYFHKLSDQLIEALNEDNFRELSSATDHLESSPKP